MPMDPINNPLEYFSAQAMIKRQTGCSHEDTLRLIGEGVKRAQERYPDNPTQTVHNMLDSSYRPTDEEFMAWAKANNYEFVDRPMQPSMGEPQDYTDSIPADND